MGDNEYKCPKCDVLLKRSITTSTVDDPNESYWNCPNCYRDFSEIWLKQYEDQPTVMIKTINDLMCYLKIEEQFTTAEIFALKLLVSEILNTFFEINGSKRVRK